MCKYFVNCCLNVGRLWACTPLRISWIGKYVPQANSLCYSGYMPQANSLCYTADTCHRLTAYATADTCHRLTAYATMEKCHRLTAYATMEKCHRLTAYATGLGFLLLFIESKPCQHIFQCVICLFAGDACLC